MISRRYDMKRPCTNCPFRTDDTAIRFANKARAEEIEASAYLFGFPCHTTADYREKDAPSRNTPAGIAHAHNGPRGNPSAGNISAPAFCFFVRPFCKSYIP